MYEISTTRRSRSEGKTTELAAPGCSRTAAASPVTPACPVGKLWESPLVEIGSLTRSRPLRSIPKVQRADRRRAPRICYAVLVGVTVVLALVTACATPAAEPEVVREEPESVPEPPKPAAEFVRDQVIVDSFPAEIRIKDAPATREDVGLSVTDEAGTLVHELEAAEPGRYLVPADGMTSGQTYRLSLLVDDESVADARMVVDVELDPPTGLYPGDGHETIDPTAQVGCETVENAEGYLVEILRGEAVISQTPSASVSVEGRTYGTVEWRMRWVRADGLRSRASEYRRLAITGEPTVTSIPGNDGELWVTDGYLTVKGYNGAVTAEVELERSDAEEESRIRAGAVIRMPPAKESIDIVVFPLTGLEDGAEYRYRTRARPDEEKWTEWTDPGGFRVSDIGLRFVPIVGRDAREFTMGYNQAFADEAPEHQVRISRPFAVQDTPLTNRQVALVFNTMLEAGTAVLEEGGVVVGEQIAMRLDELDYGTQFGLQAADGRLSPAPGRARHPAVGITWRGAVAIADLLSAAVGLPAPYSEGGEVWTREIPGVRLPTEAEWTLAARGDTTAPFPWGREVNGRRANYYRSFDPFEDVDSPFTDAGGPTAPIRFFDGSSRGGFQTLVNRSPDGVWDIVGNVWEWCWDYYDADLYAQRPADSPGAEDPIGPETGEFRVVRGCAWNTRMPDVRVTNRGRFEPGGSSFSIGVRLAVDRPAYADTP